MARRTRPMLLGRLFAFLSTVSLLSLLIGYRTTGLALNRVTASQAGTVVRVAPASQQIGVGEATTVEVRIDNVTDLAAAEMELHFNVAVLQIQDADPVQEGVQIQPGNFPSPDFVAENRADNAIGVVRYALTQLLHEPVSGSGLLASITFQGITRGNSDLTFQMVNLSTNVGQAIPATSQGGVITVGDGEQPTATFTPPPVPPTDTPVPPTDTPVPGQPTPTPVTPTVTPVPWLTPTLVPPGPTVVPTWPPTTTNRYVVQYGDTLYSISRRYGVSVWQLAAYNNIYNTSLIYAGQVLIIPGIGLSPGGYYVVKHRDTLYSISRRYGLSVWRLASYNHISNPHLIYIGQVIRIPPW